MARKSIRLRRPVRYYGDLVYVIDGLRAQTYAVQSTVVFDTRHAFFCMCFKSNNFDAVGPLSSSCM